MVDALARTAPVAAAPACNVTLTMVAPRARYSLRTRVPAGLPDKMLTTGAFAGGTALHLGPDEWLLILPENAPPPLIASVHALTDIGHRDVAIEVKGEGALALVQTGCALDLKAFPIGKATRTLFEGVEIVLWRTGERLFHVEVWRSFAEYLWAAFTLAVGDLR